MRALYLEADFTARPICAPSIACLLGLGRPADIARFVISIIIDSVDRMQRRRHRADVVAEGHEVYHPLVADPDAATAVTHPVLPLRIADARFHRSPALVNDGIDLAVGCVNRGPNDQRGARSATLVAPCPEVVPVNYFFCAAAQTDTEPSGLAPLLLGKSKNLPFIEGLPS